MPYYTCHNTPDLYHKSYSENQEDSICMNKTTLEKISQNIKSEMFTKSEQDKIKTINNYDKLNEFGCIDKEKNLENGSLKIYENL